MNTPKSCHSKQQYFAAHNLYSCNKFTFHKFNISPSVRNSHDIDRPNLSAPAVDHIKQFVQLAQSVKATHSASSNAACLPARYKVFWSFLDIRSGIVVGIKYQVTVQITFVDILLQEIKIFPFFLETSRFVHRGYCRLTERNFKVTGSTSLVPLFTGSFLFVAVSVRQIFRLCYFQCCPRSPFLFNTKSVPSNPTTWFNTYFFTSFWRSAVRQKSCSSYSIYSVLINTAVCVCFRDIPIPFKQSVLYPHFDTQPLFWTYFLFPGVVFGLILYCEWRRSLGSLKEYLNITCIFTYRIPMIHLLTP
jgi:hypothetical protein